MEILLYTLYFLALLLVPAFMLIGAEALMLAPKRASYKRLFLVLLGGCFFGALGLLEGPVSATILAVIVTMILVKLSTDAFWGDAFLMAVFGWLCGGIFALAAHSVLLPLSEHIALDEGISEEQPVIPPPPPRKTVEYTALGCLDIARDKALKTSPNILFHKLVFGRGITLNGDGRSDYCEAYFINPNGLVWLVAIEDDLVAIRAVGGDTELYRGFYETRENPELMNSPEMLSLLQSDADFSSVFSTYFNDTPDLKLKDLVVFFGIFYDETYGRYIWQVALGDRNTPEGKLVFSMDAGTGEMLGKQRVNVEKETGELIYWSHTKEGWVRQDGVFQEGARTIEVDEISEE